MATQYSIHRLRLQLQRNEVLLQSLQYELSGLVAHRNHCLAVLYRSGGQASRYRAELQRTERKILSVQNRIECVTLSCRQVQRRLATGYSY